MDSVQGTRALPRVGFPIRKSPDRRSFSSSPRLIAAIHVLHRLLVPRHPPFALFLLMFAVRENTNYRYAVFKVRTGPGRPDREKRPERRLEGGSGGASAGLSKLNSMGAAIPRDRGGVGAA